MRIRRLIRPAIVPIRVLTKLAAAGVHTTAAVHQHLEAGTLTRLRGIGPYWAARIERYYSEASP